MGLDIYHVKLSEKTENTIDYFSVDDFKENIDFLNEYVHLISFIKEEDGKSKPVLYYTEKGYHRKSMKSGFTHQFENDKLYFDLETVRKAKLFIQANTDENQQELEKLFQTNFINNFISGESIFFISW